MTLFQRHELVRLNDGSYIVKLYLASHSTEFADEFHTGKSDDKGALEKSVKRYVKEKFPNIKVNAVKIMAGTMLVSTLAFAGGMGSSAHAAENDNTTQVESDQQTENVSEGLIDIAKGSYYEEAVLALTEENVIEGFKDKTFRPGNTITRGEAAALLARSLGIEDNTAPDPGFTDVKEGKFYSKSVAVLVDAGVIDGFKDKTFKPNQTITRSELAKMIVLAYDGIDSVEGESAFTDVRTGIWYAPYVNALKKSGITLGTTDTTFSPGSEVKRGEVATFVYRALNPDKRIQVDDTVDTTPADGVTPTDEVNPVLENVSPASGEAVALAAGETFKLEVDAKDDDLRELEIDHNFTDLPEFSVYASEENPYGTEEARTSFEAQGVNVTYDAAAQKWVIDFGDAVTNKIVEQGDATFYLVLRDEAGNELGTMNGTTPENTFNYTVTQAAPDEAIPVLENVSPASGEAVTLAAGDTFKLEVDAKDDDLRELEIDHNFTDLPEFSVYASEENPYGTEEARASFEAQGVNVTYDAAAQKWVIDFGDAVTSKIVEQGDATFYLVLRDEAGNEFGTMNGTTAENTFTYTVTQAATDEVNPVLENVSPASGEAVALAAGETFKLEVDAKDDDLRELEIDHNFTDLPEFSVYASEENPYGTEEARASFEAQGVNVTYDEAAQKWVIDFGAAVTSKIVEQGDATFYLVLRDEAGNEFGTMNGTTAENTFTYTVTQAAESPTPDNGEEGV